MLYMQALKFIEIDFIEVTFQLIPDTIFRSSSITFFSFFASAIHNSTFFSLIYSLTQCPFEELTL